MMLKQPILFDFDESQFQKKPKQSHQEEKENVPSYFNTSFFTNATEKIDINRDIDNVSVSDLKENKPKKKRKSKLKIDTGESEKDDKSASILTSNEPFIERFNETNDIIKGTIAQVDTVTAKLSNEFDYISNSRTLKRKYDYLSNIASTLGTLAGTKSSLVSQLNKTITDSIKFELDRAKVNKSKEVDIDDNKMIADMYKAFVNTPVGSYTGTSVNMPTQIEMLTGGMGIQRIGVADDMQSYEQHGQEISPEMNMMLLEQNPNVKTVFCIDDKTGSKWFDVIDITTGQSVPNTTKPDAMLIDNITIDRYNKIARDKNLNEVYDLFIYNENPALNDF